MEDLDVEIFKDIFKMLNYSGFACVDFTIVNEIPYIFEINPRPGGSLIRNETYFNRFITKLMVELNCTNV